MESKKYIAHKNEENGKIQTVKEHSLNVALLCEKYAINELKDILFNIGLLHDIGKYQKSFQDRINGKNIRVEHSTCGALVAQEKYNNALCLLMQCCIAGHHSGLPNIGVPNEPGNLSKRLRGMFEDFSAYKADIDKLIKSINEGNFVNFICADCKFDEDIIEKFAFIVRYCFSCLTDADSVDTAMFCNNFIENELKADFQECFDKINNKLTEFERTTELKKSRSELQKQVYDKATLNSNIYLISMPTGSGKTICSMKFALERAIRQNKKRIIYVIPYNSIIDQTVDFFEKLFGNSAQILRHQSTFDYDSKENYDEDYRKIAKQATENWTAQIIITTSVQFFESVCSNKRKRLRKLHNMADSILVFDEVHLMPTKYMQPCLRGISYITKCLNSEAIFLTATMPDYAKLFKKYSAPNTVVTPLIEDTSLFKVFDKCSYKNLGEVSQESLIMRATESPTTLIVVNTKKTARELYGLCTGKKYHLSTYMTAVDRKTSIDNIKTEINKLEKDYPNLENVPDNQKICVISTSLIEAGVDLDFRCVFRELSGLDNILQAGGRCNREGKYKTANVFIFSLGEAMGNEKINLTEGLLRKYDNIACENCINEYYERLYFMNEGEMIANALSRKYDNIGSIKFKDYSQDFNIIDNEFISVVVGQDDTSKKLIEQSKYNNFPEYRKLQKYACQISIYELHELESLNAIENCNGMLILKNPMCYYDTHIGITFTPKDFII